MVLDVSRRERHAGRVLGRFLPLVLGTVLVSFGGWGTAVAGSSSAHYAITQSTVNSGGQVVEGPTYYTLNSSLGQELVIGTSSSPNYVLQSGFWSFGGTGLAEVYLYVTKNAIDLLDLDLDWTGKNSPYQIYRGDCAAITDWFFVQEPTNQYTDTDPLDWDLSCYKVLPTAPGPMAEQTR